MASTTTDPIHANITGINAAFIVGGIFCVVGFVLAVVFVKNKPGEAAARDPENIQRNLIESIMKHDVYTLDSRATVVEAIKLLVDKHISAAPLVNEKGRLIGFVSDGDIMRYLSRNNKIYVDPVVMIMQTGHDNEKFDEKLRKLMDMQVRDIATKRVISVDVHDDLSEVCRILGENHLKKVPVLDNDQLVGIINRSNITQYSMKAYLNYEGVPAHA